MTAEQNQRSVISAPILIGVVACFVLSGFAALLYQIAWMRQFSLVFGTSELAVAAVLSAYMGGLAVGAAIAGRFVNSISRPVLFYGLLEAGIAISALLVPWLLELTQALYVWAFGGQPEPVDASGLAQSFFYLVTAFVVLVIPTSLMGATLPLLTQYVVRTNDQVGQRVGLLYASNTLGAVVGTVVAGFLLLPALGLRGTVWVGIAVNFLVFLVARKIAASVSQPIAAEDAAQQAETVSSPVSPARVAKRHVILPLMLMSGANSFVYEVLWTRLLGHILGGSIAAFSTMLASFLAGITLGSAIASRFATTRVRAVYGFIAAQVGIAVASVLIYQLLPLVIPEQGGLRGNVLLAVLLLLPATLFIGATYPFAVRIFALDETDAAPAAANVYSWNTIGAILGATVAAFFLVPALKYEGALKFAVLLNLTLAMMAIWLIKAQRSRTLAGVLALFVVTLFAYRPGIPESILRMSPVAAQPKGELRYYEVGRSATVIVVENAGYLNLSTNGLPEASTNLKGAPPYKHNQRLLSALPVLVRPDLEEMLIVGFGAGATLEGVPPSVASVDVVELEPEVIAANRSISSEREIDPLADPRVQVIINDARSALLLTNKRYDAIVSQPSHPWTAGASHLYTREFMALAKDHLTDGGVYLQWMNTQFVDEGLLKSLCASMLDVFEYVRVYQWDPEVLFFLGSALPMEPEIEIAVTGRPLSDNPAHYLRKGVGSVEDVVTALAMDHENVVAFAQGAQPITDDVNLMATQSARAMHNGDTLRLSRLTKVLAPFDPLTQPDSWLHRDFPRPLNFTYISRRLEALGLKQRAVALAETRLDLGDSEALVMIGLGQQGQGESEESQRNLLRAVEADPERQQARYALLKPWLSRIARSSSDLPPRIANELRSIRGNGAIVIRASLAAAKEDLQALAEMDSLLSQVQPTDIWYLDAVKLRADWRIKVTSPQYQPKLAREAIGLIDEAIALFQDPDFYSMRVAASYVANDVQNVVETARRLVYIFELEVGRAEEGEIAPGEKAIVGKLRQVDALQEVMKTLRQNDRVRSSKLDALESAIARVSGRLKRLPGYRENE